VRAGFKMLAAAADTPQAMSDASSRVHLPLFALLFALLLGLAGLLTAAPLRAAETAGKTAARDTPVASERAAETRPALREAAMPRRSAAIVLPSMDEMRAAARAETPRVQAGVALPPPGAVATASSAATTATPAAASQTASNLPAVSVPAVVLPLDDSQSAAERRRASSRGFLPPLPLTARPAASIAAPVPSPGAAAGAGAAAVPALTEAATPAAPHSATRSAPTVAESAAQPSPVPVVVPPQAAPVVPPPDADSADPLERLRARLTERLAAVKPPDADSPYELQVSTRAASGAVAKRSVVNSGSKKAGAKKSAGKALGEGEWAYEGEHGPEAWGGLCANGRRQSPIDIRGGLPVALEPIRFDYQPVEFSVLDTGHTVQVNVAPGSAAVLNGQRYELKQFHFHRPSEESLDGRRFDLSVHLVHRDEQGRRLVVAVLVQQGSAQPVLRSVFGNLPLEKRQENRARISLNPAELLPGEQAYFTYMGSLTTPPCSEGVQWVVLRNPVSASAEQIDLFSRLYPNNARPLQQADGRRILQTR
jgi:carbonic anhydrase